MVGLAVGVAALLVYRTTLLPGVFAWDTAEAQAVLPLMGTMHPTGFPAFVLLGWLASVVLAPFGEPAYRMNLLAALLAATAVGLVVPLLRRLDVPLPGAAAAALGFALTPIAWSISTAADAHALHIASSDTPMADWLDAAMTTLEPDAVVVSWWSLSTTLWYGTLVDGRRPDILVVDDSDLVLNHLGTAEDVIDGYLGVRPVYVIRSTPSHIQALAVRYVLEPVGRPASVFRVTGLQETQP